MKPRIARISLVVAGILFFTGFDDLCYCPGWFGLAAAFAGVAVWAGSGRMRTWSFLLLLACLIAAGIEAFNLIHERHQHIEWIRKYGTNASGKSNTVP